MVSVPTLGVGCCWFESNLSDYIINIFYIKKIKLVEVCYLGNVVYLIKVKIKVNIYNILNSTLEFILNILIYITIFRLVFSELNTNTNIVNIN